MTIKYFNWFIYLIGLVFIVLLNFIVFKDPHLNIDTTIILLTVINITAMSFFVVILEHIYKQKFIKH